MLWQSGEELPGIQASTLSWHMPAAGAAGDLVAALGERPLKDKGFMMPVGRQEGLERQRSSRSLSEGLPKQRSPDGHKTSPHW
jgi:hypothetical protein